MDENNRNFILAIVLSIGVLFVWQYFFVPKHQPPVKPEGEQSQQVEPGPPQPQTGGEASSGGAPQPGAAVAATMTRDEALAQSPRIAIDTPSVKGSIALKGGRIDDLTLKDYRETVEPTSPMVVLLSPAGGPGAYYAEHGFVGGPRRRRSRAAHRRDGVDRGDARPAHAKLAGDALLRQRQGAEIHPHHLGRRQIYVHGRRQGRQYRLGGP